MFNWFKEFQKDSTRRGGPATAGDTRRTYLVCVEDTLTRSQVGASIP